MHNHITEAINYSEDLNFFIKLLVLSNDNKDFTLFYGFCVPTKQPIYSWKFPSTETKQQSICSAVLSWKEAATFAHNLTNATPITLKGKNLKSPKLLKRPVALSNDGKNKTTGPVSEFCRVIEYWNTDKNALLEKIQASFESDGKELYQNIQNLLKWAREECGIDFYKDAKRIGNYEVYDLQSNENAFDMEIYEEWGLKKTTILKRTFFSKNLIVNCVAEHRGRTILNQTKLFPISEQQLDFFADEPMSRVIVQVWEVKSGNLIFSKDLTLMMNLSFTLNIGSPTYQIRDSWSKKLFESASNLSDTIKAQIETVSKSTATKTTTIKSSTYNAIDKAIEDSRTLLFGYQQNQTKGAFIFNNHKDGEINSFLKIREYIKLPSVKKAVIADSYFDVISAQKLLARIPRTDMQLFIITSLTDNDSDTNNKKDICKQTREFLNDNASILHDNLSIINLTRGKNPAFHDRYLIRFFDDGRIDGFLLSNSFNSMGQFYPFVIAPMEQVVCYEVCDYLYDLCNTEVQPKRSRKERINIEFLCNFRKGHKSKATAESEYLPFDLWLSHWCLDGEFPNIPKEELASVVNTLWEHWENDRILTCKMLSYLGSTERPWSAKDLAYEIESVDGAEKGFIKKFVKIAKVKEKQQNHIANGINSDVYVRSALLKGQGEPSRQGLSKLFHESGCVFYAGDNWLKGGYKLLLQLEPSKFIILLDEIKSPLMFDVLSMQMLFYSWDGILFNAAINSKNTYVKLLCGEYLFHQLKENRLTATQIEEVITKLSPADSSLQLSYLLSQLVFYARTSRFNKVKEETVNSIYVWMIKKLAVYLTRCNEEMQSLALHWLYDCEIQSNCMLRMNLAEVESDLEIRNRLYKEIITAIEFDLIKTTYSRDITKLIDIYLQAIDALYGQKSEKELLGGIIDWRVFEIATEPVLMNYNYSKWSLADVRAKWQMCILKEYISRNPYSEKAKEWLEYWEPRMKAID